MVLCTVAVVACRPAGDFQRAYGNFEAYEVVLSPEITGRIEKFGAEEGDALDSGTVVVHIDTVPLLLRQKQLKASQGVAKARVEQLLLQQEVVAVQLSSVQNERSRFDQLFAEGAATAKQIDDWKAQERVALANLKAAEAAVATARSETGVWETQIAFVRDQAERCRIKTPQKGTMIQKYARVGEMAMQGKPLLKMAALDRLYLRAYVSGDQLAHLQLGQKMAVGFDRSATENNWVDGVVTWISSEAEFTPKIIQTKESRVHLVYAIKVLVANDGRIKMGMPGELKW